jgi:hypothetical protein
VPFQHLPAHHGAVDVALRVAAEAFGAGVVGGRRFHVLDEGRDPAVFGAADADALLDPRQLVRAGIGTRLRVGDVDRVVLGDEDAARAAELPPLVEKRAVLIEDLNPAR